MSSQQDVPQRFCSPFGVNAKTGALVLPRISYEQLGKALIGDTRDERAATLAKAAARDKEAPLALPFGVCSQRLDQTGWAIVFPRGADAAYEAALRPLLDVRRSQAGDRFKVFKGDDGYVPGENPATFLQLRKVPTMVEPPKLPYYILVVGGPSEIPFSFESILGTQYAIGRLDPNGPAELERYADAVVAHEQAAVTDATFYCFGTANPNDDATTLSLRYLVEPLVSAFPKAYGRVEAARGSDAKKARLAAFLGASGPRLVMTATHGLRYDADDPEQRAGQGALVCQEWSGHGTVPTPAMRFGGEDVDGSVDLRGTIAFLYGCYTAGTPVRDSYWITSDAGRSVKQLAHEPFISNLAKRMLGHEKPALAVVGHVDRTWGSSFYWPGVGGITSTFNDFITRLYAGNRLGSSLLGFIDTAKQNQSKVASEDEQRRWGNSVDNDAYVDAWIAARDGSSYVTLGDPAVRLVPPKVAPHP